MAGPSYGAVPFREQIEFFRRKRSVLTDSWLDVFEAQHDTAFMVAGANRTDLLADFREAVDRIIAEGGTLADFRRDFDRIVERYGWQYNGGRNWRTRIIYETNLRQSYNAGRWAQLQAVKASRPYWRYRHSDAVQFPRPLHVAWDGMVLSADDPWWHTNFPANGWGCQCYVDALNARDLRRLGKAGPDRAPPIDLQPVIVGQRSPGGPRVVMTPAGVDPGFGYAPGRSLGLPPDAVPAPPTPDALVRVLERAAQFALDKARRLPPITGAHAAEVVLSRPRAVQAMQGGLSEWITDSLSGDVAVAGEYLIGALTPLQAQRAGVAGIAIPTALIGIRAADLPGLGPIAPGAGHRILALLRTPLAVLLDAAAERLLYLLRDGDALRVVVVVAARGRPQAANLLASIDDADVDALAAEVFAGRLRILEGGLP